VFFDWVWCFLWVDVFWGVVLSELKIVVVFCFGVCELLSSCCSWCFMCVMLLGEMWGMLWLSVDERLLSLMMCIVGGCFVGVGCLIRYNIVVVDVLCCGLRNVVIVVVVFAMFWYLFCWL